MKFKKLTLWAILTVTVWSVQCASKGNVKPLSEGERLFRNLCQSCHALPAKDAQRNWQKVLKQHESRLNLSESEKEKLLEYLVR